VFQQPEYKLRVINTFFQQMLDHNPNGAESADFAEALGSGMTDQEVLALLATTTPYREYFDKTVN
jgi:hypothetical protein